MTAGPTYEAIDPVRFIGNHSSGKMGYALADALAAAGAEVTIISGPTSVEAEDPRVKKLQVTTAQQMFEACEQLISQMDIAVFAAAVADFTPGKAEEHKIKRGREDLVLKLVPTRDIAAELGKKKREEQVFVGFALETRNAVESAVNKLKRKNFDMIVINTLEDEGAGFGTDTNKVSIMDKSGNIDTFDLKPKKQVARDIVEKIIKFSSHA